MSTDITAAELPLAQIQRLNQELIVARELLHQRDEELRRINDELILTNSGVVMLYAELVQRSEELRVDVAQRKQIEESLRVHQIELEMQNHELRRAQEELAKAEARYFDLYELAPVGYCTVSEKGLILQANLAAANLLCMDRRALVKQLMFLLILIEDRDIYYLLCKQMVDGEQRGGELRMVRNDNTPVWVHLAISLHYDGDTPVFRIVLSDITRLKQSEDVLRKNEELNRSIIHTATDGFWRFDTHGYLLEVNEAYCRMSGYSQEELLTMQVADLEAVETPEQVAVHMCQIIAQGHDRFESRHRRKDGNLFDVAISLNYLPLHGSQFVLFVQDITERKQVEQKLQLAASVFTHAREGIMITATDGTIIDVNDAFSDITSYSRDEVIGQNPRLLSSGRHERQFYSELWQNLLEKGHWYGEIWNRRKNGEVYAVMQTISAVRDAKDNPRHYLSLFSDITQIKEREQELEHSAHYDPLTSLPNRTLLADRLHQGIAQARRRGSLLGVAFLDLDGFKIINDTYGHEAGDQLLIAVATNMKQTLREGDTLARMGGDEFVAELLDLVDVEASAPMLARLLTAAAEPMQYGDLTLQVSASLGVTFYPQAENIDADQLLRQADQAMYQAKQAGKNRYHIFDAVQDSRVRGRYESLEFIRRALAKGEFVLYYQPYVDMRKGTVIGAEALIRWQHPDKGLLSPAAFLPVIEDHPLAVDIGEWVIETALAQIESWLATGLNIQVSVNVGARQLQQTDFVERLRALLAAHPGVSPSCLKMEVLETSALINVARVSQVIETCRGMGVMFAMDDFGTGYSSLTYLKQLPVATIKIDQSFVRGMLYDPDDLAILKGVLSLSGAFHREVVAEGVETIEQGAMLLQLGCDLAQGNCIGRPMPANELPDWLVTWCPDPSWAESLPL